MSRIIEQLEYGPKPTVNQQNPGIPIHNIDAFLRELITPSRSVKEKSELKEELRRPPESNDIRYKPLPPPPPPIQPTHPPLESPSIDEDMNEPLNQGANHMMAGPTLDDVNPETYRFARQSFPTPMKAQDSPLEDNNSMKYSQQPNNPDYPNHNFNQTTRNSFPTVNGGFRSELAYNAQSAPNSLHNSNAMDENWDSLLNFAGFEQDNTMQGISYAAPSTIQQPIPLHGWQADAQQPLQK